MRIRRKPWARPELAACPFAVDEPRQNRGCWAECFPVRQPIWLELGCGKGVFLAKMAPQHPEANFIGIDLKSDVLGLAKRNIEAAYAAGARPVENVLLLAYNIERIGEVLAPEDQVARLFIYFCNPWPKHKQQKKRLTHPRQLAAYKAFLQPGARIDFKTDDDDLYQATRRYFVESGFEILRDIPSLVAENAPEPALVFCSEHEEQFRAMGLDVHYIEARWPGPAAGEAGL